MLDLRGKNRTDLARQIRNTILNFTHGRPMPAEDIIRAQAFCVGLTVGFQSRKERARFRQMVTEMLEAGESIAIKDAHQQHNNVIDLEAIRKS